jgi:capsule polysaccharide export protein KpsE/RkpR
MKTPASKLILISGLLATACMFTVPAVHAADDKAEKKAKKAQADLKKYDKNANGKLDPDEEAALKADVEKQKSEKKKKKDGGE